MLAALFLILLAIPAAATAQSEGAPTAMWAHDALARALSACDDITDSFHRAQGLAEIAEVQVAASETDTARKNLARALAIAQSIDEEALRNWALSDVGLAYVKLDDLDAAEAAVESLRDVRLHDGVLAAVVDARRGVRDLTGAQATAKHMRDPARQGMSLRAIAIQQAADNDFSAAMFTVRSIQHARANALAIGDVAAALARSGSFDEALGLVVRIRDTESRSRALVEVAVAQAEVGDVKGAIAMTAQVDDKLERAAAVARIAAIRGSSAPAEARAMFTQVLAVVAGARASPNRKADTLVEIARAQLLGNDPAASATLKRAFGELGNVKGDAERLNLLSRIAPLQARAGDYAGAFATAMRADDASLRPLLVRDVAMSQAERGDVAGAIAIARSLDDRPAAAAALFGVLRVQSQAHDLSGLKETIGVTLQAVRVIGSAELRAGALGSLAVAHAREGDFAAAEAVFTEAMATAAAVDGGQQRAAIYARIADSLADRRRPFTD